MTLESCPSCDRAFKSVEDYPKIYLASVVREEIPEYTRFPLGPYRFSIFVDPKEQPEMSNSAVPAAVMELFAGKPRSEEDRVEYHGWQWIRNVMGFINTETTPYTDHRTYSYQLYNNDSIGLIRNVVLYRLNRYLGRLEEQVGQEVPQGVLMPPNLLGGYRAEFNFDLGEVDEATGLNSINLSVNYHAGGTFYEIKPIVQVATIDYEGRLNN